MDPLRPTDPPHTSAYFLTSHLSARDLGPVHPTRVRFAYEADAARRVSEFHTAQVVDADPSSEALWDRARLLPIPRTVVTCVRDTERAVAYRLAG
ncbi:hypothetical protein HNR06_004440 [Nocardiopsis arvandica]|uniref:Uncharacterized protein n=1 Tax=Nocardiopsis sinuspersici TaxID=501010 RepID=A0A7Y9XFK0_9ACTN|nr:hypothetical protein [Nocardiopsis sinuspersici]NYH54851.1 hypothetical protein [Nocardiopsis sinuspersici]